ncbi:MAG: GSCFA domain-containing protein [Planctomycetota bacterium]
MPTATQQPTIRTQHLREVFAGLVDRFRGRPIALYGAGRHTARLLRVLAPGTQRPAIACVIDDDPARAGTLPDGDASIPVLSPAESDPRLVAAVVVSTDAHQARLTERALAWASSAGAHAPEVVTLYADGVVPVTPLTVAEPELHPCAPAGALVPVIEEPSEQVTPEFTVRFARAARGNEPHQHRPYQRFATGSFPEGASLDPGEFVTDRRPGLIGRDTPVSVVGSCFVRHLRRWLIAEGYNFCQWEDGPRAGASSVRNGQVYTAAAFEQMIRWAYEGFDAMEESWPALGGGLACPYRRWVGWPDERSMRAERTAHFNAVRNMVERSEVLLFTLGLSETWRRRDDHTTFYARPPAELLDERLHEHHLLSPEETEASLERAYERMRGANPGLQLVLTLSPIPLKATGLDRHVVLSDTVSKANLRVAIDRFCRNNPEVVYFPSYEIVTRTPAWKFDDDHRHITDQGVVQQIMRTFMGAYGEPEAEAVASLGAA